MNSGNEYAKYRFWGTDASYGIGMVSGQTYGYLNDYATTFVMNDDADRGWKWMANTDAVGEGSMSLTVDGRLYTDQFVNATKFVQRSGGEISSDGTTMRFTF